MESARSSLAFSIARFWVICSTNKIAMAKANTPVPMASHSR